MAELEVDALASRLGGHEDLRFVPEDPLRPDPILQAHPAVDRVDPVSPVPDLFLQVFEGVAGFGEDEDLLVLRIGKALGELSEGGLEILELDLPFVLNDLLGLGDQVVEGGDLRLQVLPVFSDAQGFPELFFLPALLFGEVLDGVEIEGLLGGLALFLCAPEEICQALSSSLQGTEKGVGAGGEAALEDDQREGDVAFFIFCEGLVVLGVHVAGKVVVELLLRGGIGAEIEGEGLHVPGEKEGPPFEVFQVLLDAADEERIVSAGDGLVEHFVRGEEARLQEVQEEAKILGIAPVGRGREKQEVLRDPGEGFSQFVAARSFRLVAVSEGAHLVRLVHDDQVEMGGGQGGQDVIPLGKIERGDDLGLPAPDVLAVEGVQQAAFDHQEVLLEAFDQLPAPLVLEVAWGDDENPPDEVAELHLLDDQAGHDRFSGSRIVGDEKADAGQLQDVAVNRLDLVGQGVHLGGVHSQERIV